MPSIRASRSFRALSMQMACRRHVHTIRKLGMGLDEKAIEAVRQYRFKPGLLNGKPVAVEITIEVNFHIY